MPKLTSSPLVFAAFLELTEHEPCPLLMKKHLKINIITKVNALNFLSGTDTLVYFLLFVLLQNSSSPLPHSPQEIRFQAHAHLFLMFI